MLRNSESNILLKLRQTTKYYYKYYLSSIIFLYIAILVFLWYFIKLAYNINEQNYNILEANCSGIFCYVKNIFLLTSLFNCYFYLINELRFKFIVNFKKSRVIDIAKGNIMTVFLSLFIFILTLFLIF